MKGFDEQLANLEGLGLDIPGFEDWEKDFDLEKWREENPEDAAMIDVEDEKLICLILLSMMILLIQSE